MAPELVGHVFMSYSRTDEAIMRRIVTFLRKQGVQVWVDNEKLIPGTPIWEAEIEKAIFSASATIVILSPDSKESVWVRREISYAERYKKRIFPVLVRGDEDSSISLRLATNQYIDFRKNEEIGLNSLNAALISYIEELETQAKRTREDSEKMARAEAEQQLAEREAARLKLERDATERASRDAQEKAAREQAEQERLDREQLKEQGAEEKQSAYESAEVQRKVKEELIVPVVIEIEEKSAQVQPNRIAVSPSWLYGLWITIGWTIAIPVSLLIGTLIGAVVGLIAVSMGLSEENGTLGLVLKSSFVGVLVGAVIGGTAGGFIIATALNNEHVLSRPRYILIMLGWAIGAGIGLLVNGPIGGIIGGITTAIALRIEDMIPHWSHMFLITLGWAIGWAIIESTFKPESGDITSLVIGVAVGVAIGGFVTIWQLRKAKKQTEK
jgi:hypothetical protein